MAERSLEAVEEFQEAQNNQINVENENEVNNFQRALLQAKDNYKEAPNTVINTSGADELKKYKDLLDSGVISQADFDNAKKKILG